MNIILVLLALFPVTHGSVFLHELGHAVMAWSNRHVVTSFGIGQGKALWVTTWRRARVYLCAGSMGMTFIYSPALFPTAGAVARIMMGGILAHLALIAVGLLMNALWPSFAALWWLIVGLNAYYALVSLIPFHFTSRSTPLRNDAALMLQALRDGSLRQSPTARIRQVAGFRQLWQAVGDTRGHSVFLLSAAEAWLELGDCQAAERAYHEAQELAPDGAGAYRQFVRGELNQASGDLAGRAAALDELERFLRDGGNQVGLLHVALGRCMLWVRQGEVARAAAHLADLASDPLRRRRADLALHFFEARLEVARAAASDADPAAIAAEWHALQKDYPEWARHLPLLKQLARYYSQHEDWRRAEGAYRSALNLARDYCSELDDADRARFIAAQSDLRADARACFLHLGQEKHAAQVESFYFPDTPAKPRRAETLERQRQRIFRFSLVMNVLGAAVMAHTLGTMLFFEFASWDDLAMTFEDGGLLGILRRLLSPMGAQSLPILMMAFAVGVAIVSTAVTMLFGRRSAALQRIWQLTLLATGLLPWLFLVGVEAILLLD